MLVGSPLQDSVAEGAFNYYYLQVSEKMLFKWSRLGASGTGNRPIYIVLNTELGDADLYVRMQTNSDLTDRTSWAKPTKSNYDFKSTATLA